MLHPLDKSAKNQEEKLLENNAGSQEYLDKPTVIMCNPNAFSYQQMVIAPNAYWLNFFLKRDINVVCWNYRGYGQSTIGFFSQSTPAIAKMDVERVLADSVR